MNKTKIVQYTVYRMRLTRHLHSTKSRRQRQNMCTLLKQKVIVLHSLNQDRTNMAC